MASIGQHMSQGSTLSQHILTTPKFERQTLDGITEPYEYRELKHSYIFDFYKDHIVVSLSKHNITGIHALKKEIPINGIVYDNNCRITTNKGFIIEILFSTQSKSFLYRLVYENVKIKYVLDSKGTLEDYDELIMFLDYVICEILNQE